MSDSTAVVETAPAPAETQPVTEVAKPERARNEQGQFVKAENEAAERGLAMLRRRLPLENQAPQSAPAAEIKDTDPAQAEPADEAEKPKETGSQSEATREADLQTLRLTGLKSKHLGKFDDDELHEIAEHERKRQADNDAKVTRANEVLKRGGAAAAQDPQPSHEGPAFDPDTEVQQLVDEFGSEAASKFGSILKKQQSAFDARLSKHEEYLEILAKGHWSANEERARTRLAGRYPQVVDDDTFRPVKDKADQLFAGGQYASLDEAYADAAAIKLGKSGPTKSDSASRYRANGQPSLATRASPPASVSKDQKVVAFLSHRLRQVPSDEARRLAGLG